MAATKLILRKLACTINANAVRGRSYENFFTKIYHIRKFTVFALSDAMAIIYFIARVCATLFYIFKSSDYLRAALIIPVAAKEAIFRETID